MVFSSKNNVTLLIVFLIIFLSNIYCTEMWEISLDDGNKYTCTQLNRLKKDSLYTESMNETLVFSVKSIMTITSYKGNVNYLLMGGSTIGGILGLAIESFVKGNGKIDTKNNGITITITGLIAGALIAHLLSINDTIDLSEMTVTEKNRIIESLILKI